MLIGFPVALNFLHVCLFLACIQYYYYYFFLLCKTLLLTSFGEFLLIDVICIRQLQKKINKQRQVSSSPVTRHLGFCDRRGRGIFTNMSDHAAVKKGATRDGPDDNSASSTENRDQNASSTHRIQTSMDTHNSAGGPEVVQDQALAPLAELTDRSKSNPKEEEDSEKWEEICIGFWKQTRLQRKTEQPGKCYGINITLHKQ